MSGRKRITSIQNNISTLFILYMVTVYPLIMHNKYFDITATKYKTFEIGVCIYAVLMAVAVVVDVLCDRRHNQGGHGSVNEAEKQKGIGHICSRYNIRSVDIWFAGFILANTAAFAVAENKMAAYTGEDGRMCGLQFMLLVMFMYICLARKYRFTGIELPAYMVTGTGMAVIAVLQFVGLDVLGLRKGLSVNIEHIYISTIGNIDIFASFLCVLVPVAMGVYLCDNALWRRIIAGVVIASGMAAAVVTNANLAYAGIGVAVVILILVAVYRGAVTRLVEVMALMTGGCVTVRLALRATDSSELEVISLFMAESKAVVVVFLMCVAVAGCMRYVCSRHPEYSVSGRKPCICVGAAMTVMAVILGVFLISKGYGRIDDSWGTYRGYVWNRLINIYSDFPLHKKLFGNGNESVKALMKGQYYDEMMNLVGVVYDNAHNEYLQYLVTTGLVGLVTYAGFLVSAFVMALKSHTGLALGIAGYAAQAVFNLNQPLTTPLLFLLAAMAVGLGRHVDKR